MNSDYYIHFVQIRMKTLEVYLSEEEINEQDCIDSLRQDGKWDDVKKQHKQYIRLLKQKKEFTSRYKSEEERVAYGETV